jgi:hypothetical protein
MITTPAAAMGCPWLGILFSKLLEDDYGSDEGIKVEKGEVLEFEGISQGECRSRGGSLARQRHCLAGVS